MALFRLVLVLVCLYMLISLMLSLLLMLLFDNDYCCCCCSSCCGCILPLWFLLELLLLVGHRSV